MTHVLSVTLLENCLDSSTVKEFELDEPLDEQIMNALAEDAGLKYYPHFPKPYFRIDRAHHYVIQGVMGSLTFRVTFSPTADEETEKTLVSAIES
jgi:hypothetical protein